MYYFLRVAVMGIPNHERLPELSAGCLDRPDVGTLSVVLRRMGGVSEEFGSHLPWAFLEYGAFSVTAAGKMWLKLHPQKAGGWAGVVMTIQHFKLWSQALSTMKRIMSVLTGCIWITFFPFLFFFFFFKLEGIILSISWVSGSHDVDGHDLVRHNWIILSQSQLIPNKLDSSVFHSTCKTFLLQ